MRRILAEVLESNASAPATQIDGLPWHDVTCHVKLLSSVPESHHLPEDVKDTTLTVHRRALFDHEYKPGARIILSPDECAASVGRQADAPQIGSLRGRVVMYRTDINADGFAERIVENSFLRVVIGPRYGARIWEIHHKRTGWNPLSATYSYSTDSCEIGGQDDHIFEQGWPGEFWNARFQEKEAVTDENGFRGVYEFNSEKSKGVTVTKEITVPVDAPLVHFCFTIKYAGAEKPPEDGKPDEYQATFWPRIPVTVPYDKSAWYAFTVPTKARLHRLRRTQGWRRPRCFGLSAPYMLALDEESGRCLALLLDPDRHRFTEVKDGRADFVTIEPMMRVVMVHKDGEQSFGYALVIGDTADAASDGLSIRTRGPRDGGHTPVFTLNSREPEVEYPGLPKIAHNTSWLSRKGGKRE